MLTLLVYLIGYTNPKHELYTLQAHGRKLVYATPMRTLPIVVGTLARHLPEWWTRKHIVGW